MGDDLVELDHYVHIGDGGKVLEGDVYVVEAHVSYEATTLILGGVSFLTLQDRFGVVPN